MTIPKHRARIEESFSGRSPVDAALDVLQPVLTRARSTRTANFGWQWILYYRTSIPSLPAVAASWTSDTKDEARWHRAAHSWIFVAAAMMHLDARGIGQLLRAAPALFGSGDALVWSLETLHDLEAAWYRELAAISSPAERGAS
jgi:hypothetical protein